MCGHIWLYADWPAHLMSSVAGTYVQATVTIALAPNQEDLASTMMETQASKVTTGTFAEGSQR